jgi:hypothetical protein
MLTKIDPKQLQSVSGGVRPGPNGEGCTGPFPRPTGPTSPTGPGFPPFQIPGENQPIR